MLQGFGEMTFIKKIYRTDGECLSIYFLRNKIANYKKTKDLFILVAENNKKSNIKGEGYGKVQSVKAG